MIVITETSPSGEEVVIGVQGRFDFSSHQAFREAYERSKAKRFIIDLAETSYLDSSALGMLLLLRDHAGGDEASIKVINCSDDVKKIFSISNFEQLFSIS